MNDKPLFVPLCGHYYDEFEAGTKVEEIRVLGPRWNEHVCQPGRRVTLSRGYSKGRRLHGSVEQIRYEPASRISPAIRRVLKCRKSATLT